MGDEIPTSCLEKRSRTDGESELILPRAKKGFKISGANYYYSSICDMIQYETNANHKTGPSIEYDGTEHCVLFGVAGWNSECYAADSMTLFAGLVRETSSSDRANFAPRICCGDSKNDNYLLQSRATLLLVNRNFVSIYVHYLKRCDPFLNVISVDPANNGKRFRDLSLQEVISADILVVPVEEFSGVNISLFINRCSYGGKLGFLFDKNQSYDSKVLLELKARSCYHFCWKRCIIEYDLYVDPNTRIFSHFVWLFSGSRSKIPNKFYYKLVEEYSFPKLNCWSGGNSPKKNFDGRKRLLDFIKEKCSFMLTSIHRDRLVTTLSDVATFQIPEELETMLLYENNHSHPPGYTYPLVHKIRDFDYHETIKELSSEKAFKRVMFTTEHYIELLEKELRAQNEKKNFGTLGDNQVNSEHCLSGYVSVVEKMFLVAVKQCQYLYDVGIYSELAPLKFSMVTYSGVAFDCVINPVELKDAIGITLFRSSDTVRHSFSVGLCPKTKTLKIRYANTPVMLGVLGHFVKLGQEATLEHDLLYQILVRICEHKSLGESDYEFHDRNFAYRSELLNSKIIFGKLVSANRNNFFKYSFDHIGFRGVFLLRVPLTMVALNEWFDNYDRASTDLYFSHEWGMLSQLLVANFVAIGQEKHGKKIEKILRKSIEQVIPDNESYFSGKSGHDKESSCVSCGGHMIGKSLIMVCGHVICSDCLDHVDFTSDHLGKLYTETDFWVSQVHWRPRMCWKCGIISTKTQMFFARNKQYNLAFVESCRSKIIPENYSAVIYPWINHKEENDVTLGFCGKQHAVFELLKAAGETRTIAVLPTFQHVLDMQKSSYDFGENICFVESSKALAEKIDQFAHADSPISRLVIKVGLLKSAYIFDNIGKVICTAENYESVNLNLTNIISNINSQPLDIIRLNYV